MARCESCGLFCGVENEAAIIDADIASATEDSVEVQGSVTLTLSTACCSDELASEDLEFNIELQIDHAPDCPVLAEGDKAKEPSYSLEDHSAEATDRFETTDRHGKPIKNPRYQRHYYGADVEVTVRCDHCEATANETTTVEEQASSLLP